jgi:hypothetical protein
MNEERKEKHAWVVFRVRMDLKRAGGEEGLMTEGKGTETAEIWREGTRTSSGGGGVPG